MSEIKPTEIKPTQVRFPWRAALRTFLAFFVGAGVVLPIAHTIFVEVLGRYLSPEALAAVAWSVGLVAAMGLFITRIMAIPQVNDLLTRTVDIGAAPKSEAEPAEPVALLPKRAIRPEGSPLYEPHEGPQS